MSSSGPPTVPAVTRETLGFGGNPPRSVAPPAVGVAPGLDRHAVVAGIIGDVLHDDAVAGLGVTAIGVRPGGGDRQAVDGDVLAQVRGEVPERAVDDGHAG